MARVPTMTARTIVPLTEAERRVLAEDLIAPIDLPRFDNSAMDGYAVRFTDLTPGQTTRLPLSGRVTAGHALEKVTETPARCASLPRESAGQASIQSSCKKIALSRDGAVRRLLELAKGANLRQQGKDIACGSVALLGRPPAHAGIYWVCGRLLVSPNSRCASD